MLARAVKLHRLCQLFLILSALASATTPALALVKISGAATSNMVCSGGLCTPTASDAVLNVGDLETMLASGDVEVTTTGGGVQAYDIDVVAPFSWSSASTLSLDSYRWTIVDRTVRVKGAGGLTVKTDDGGTGGYFLCRRGRISFANLSSTLTINGGVYTLVNSVKSLASAIAANSSGDYALANNYDASQDGIYSNTPITTDLTGTVEGLGNTISNVRVNIAKHTYFNAAGLILGVDFGATIENLTLATLKVTMAPYERGISENLAGLVVTNQGLLFNDHVSGSISMDAKNSGGSSLVGGLVAYNEITISHSSSSVNITTDGGGPGGLLAYTNGGNVYESYATGSVKGTRQNGETVVGGLIGLADTGTTISNSYAVGSVEGVSQGPHVGGFAGASSSGGAISTSYAANRVKASGGGGLVGGFVGQDLGSPFQDCYWDTTTSGTDQGTGEGNVTGITGLTTKQLRKGLPTGFDPTIWAEDKKINNGFPYLIANPPPDK